MSDPTARAMVLDGPASDPVTRFLDLARFDSGVMYTSVQEHAFALRHRLAVAFLHACVIVLRIQSYQVTLKLLRIILTFTSTLL
jgi:hypothetical protein